MKKLLIIAIGFLYPHANWSMSNHCGNDSLKRSFIQMTSTDMANYCPGKNDSADLPNNNQSNAISIENESLESDNYPQDVNLTSFPCPYPECEKYKKGYSRNADLQNHINHKHLGKGYACTWPGCKVTIARKSNQVTHMRTHTGEKPYQCKHCAHKCSRSDSLKIHEKTCQAAQLAATQILLSMAKDEGA